MHVRITAHLITVTVTFNTSPEADSLNKLSYIAIIAQSVSLSIQD